MFFGNNLGKEKKIIFDLFIYFDMNGFVLYYFNIEFWYILYLYMIMWILDEVYVY